MTFNSNTMRKRLNQNESLEINFDDLKNVIHFFLNFKILFSSDFKFWPNTWNPSLWTENLILVCLWLTNDRMKWIFKNTMLQIASILYKCILISLDPFDNKWIHSLFNPQNEPLKIKIKIKYGFESLI